MFVLPETKVAPLAKQLPTTTTPTPTTPGPASMKTTPQMNESKARGPNDERVSFGP
jgi:hypothetical protein